MSRKKNNTAEYGRHTRTALGLMEKLEPNYIGDETCTKDLSMDELRLLNGYKSCVDDPDCYILQTFGNRNLEITRFSTYRFFAWCMELDKKEREAAHLMMAD